MSATVPKTEPATSRLLSYQDLDVLHALRGFCAFYVMVYHAKFVLWVGGTKYLETIPRATWSLVQYGAFALDVLSSAGFEMVIFFFVLSGFFIRYAQLKRYRPAFRFYLNRIVRIYPPFLAAVVLSGSVLAYLAHAHPTLLTASIGRELNGGLLGAWNELRTFTALKLVRSLVFMKSEEYFLGYDNVFWSLFPEALFYLAVPIAFRRIRYYYALSAVCYASGLLAIALHLRFGVLESFVFIYNGYFALGVRLYDVVTTRPRWLEVFRQANGYLLAGALSALLLVLIVVAALHLDLVSGPVAALLAITSVSTLLAGRVSRQNLAVRGFHELGTFSFSLYLYHFPLLLLSYAGLVSLTGSLVNPTRYYWLAVPLVTAGCYVLYYVTERVAVRFFRGT